MSENTTDATTMPETDTDTTQTDTTAEPGGEREEGKLSRENARRRIEAKGAREEADRLRAELDAIKLQQAREAIQREHAELTDTILDKYAPKDATADQLTQWAEDTIAFVDEINEQRKTTAKKDDSALKQGLASLRRMHQGGGTYAGSTTGNGIKDAANKLQR